MITGREFAKRIKELSAKNSIPVKRVLEDCKINRNYIYDLENKIKYPQWEKILDIAQYFNVSTDYILGLTDIPCNTLSQSQTELTENEREILRILNTIPDKRQQIKFIGRIEQEAKEYAASKDIVKQFKEIGDAQLAALGSSAQTVETPNPDLVNESIENLKNT